MIAFHVAMMSCGIRKLMAKLIIYLKLGKISAVVFCKLCLWGIYEKPICLI